MGLRNVRAIAKPIPELAPVINATFPASLLSVAAMCFSPSEMYLFVLSALVNSHKIEDIDDTIPHYASFLWENFLQLLQFLGGPFR